MCESNDKKSSNKLCIRNVLNFEKYIYMDNNINKNNSSNSTLTLNSKEKDSLLSTHPHLKGFTRDISRRCYYKDIGNGKQLCFTDAMIHTNVITPIICNIPQLPPLCYK